MVGSHLDFCILVVVPVLKFKCISSLNNNNNKSVLNLAALALTLMKAYLK